MALQRPVQGSARPPGHPHAVARYDGGMASFDLSRWTGDADGALARLAELERTLSPHPLFLPVEGLSEPGADDDERPPRPRLSSKASAQISTRSKPSLMHAQQGKKDAEKTSARPAKPATRTIAPASPPPPARPAKQRFPETTMAMNADGHSSSSSPPIPPAAAIDEVEDEVEVVELSPSDGSNAEGPSAPTKSHPRPRRKSTVRADTSADLRKRLQTRAAAKLPAPAVEQKATAASSARRGAGARGKKPRLSFEQAADEVYKKKTSFATISDYLSHLDEFERDPVAGAKPRVLSGTRIVFVNTDHWRKGGSSAASAAATGPVRNRFDQALRNNMRIAAKHGAVLVKPEDFVPPPFDVGDDNAAALDPQRPDDEQWTTHIIPLELPGHRRARYAEVLRCLGSSPEGLNEDELGPFVHVVGFDWVSQAVKARGRPVEGEFAFPGDFRAAARRTEERNEEAARALEKRRKELKRERKKKEEIDKAKARRQGARGRAGDLQEDTEEEEDEDGEGEVTDGVSCVAFPRRPSDSRSPRSSAVPSDPTTGLPAKRLPTATSTASRRRPRRALLSRCAASKPGSSAAKRPLPTATPT